MNFKTNTQAVKLSTRYNKLHLLIFVAVFAIIGGILLLIRSSADLVTTLEAETISFSNAEPVTAPIGNGRAIKLNGTTSGTKDISLPTRTTKLDIHFNSTQCGSERPRLIVTIDGQTAVNHVLPPRTAAWQSIRVPLNLGVGIHRVNVSFANGFQNSTCLRGILLERFDFTGNDPLKPYNVDLEAEAMKFPSDAHELNAQFSSKLEAENMKFPSGGPDLNAQYRFRIEAENMKFPAGENKHRIHVEIDKGQIAPKGSEKLIKGPPGFGNKDRALELRKSATSTTQVTTLQPLTNITLYAKGNQCEGAPRAVIRIDGKIITSFEINSDKWRSYNARASIPAGNHAVSVAYVNEHTAGSKATCFRSVAVSRLTLSGQAAGSATEIINGSTMNDQAIAISRGATIAANRPVELRAAVTNLSLHARGEQCDGAPQADIAIDGKRVASVMIDSSEWKIYDTKVSIAKGAHTISLSFANDHSTRACNRNLVVSRIMLSGQDPEAIRQVGGVNNQDKAVALYKKATGSGDVRTPGTVTRLQLRAKGDQCDGAPRVAVSVDGKRVAVVKVDSTSWKQYANDVSLAKGHHSISLTYINDTSSAELDCDRNVAVSAITLSGPDPEAIELVSGLGGSDKAIALFKKADGEGSIRLPNKSDKLILHAKGTQCHGAPDITVNIDGERQAVIKVDSGSWKAYEVRARIPAGQHKVSLSYLNDGTPEGAACNRAVAVSKISFTGKPVEPVDNRNQGVGGGITWVTPSLPDPPAFNPSSRNTLIILRDTGIAGNAVTPEEDAQYNSLAGNDVNLTFRSSDYDHNSEEIRGWEGAGRPYFYTAASSDYVSVHHASHGAPGNTVYASVETGHEVLGREHAKGLYLHELVEYQASLQNYSNWNSAVDNIDWSKIDAWVMDAKARDKKVVWSDPAMAWTTMKNNPRVQALFAKWGPTLVPMFATNEERPGNEHMAESLRGAAGVASVHNMQLGESVQTWYFKDHGIETTPGGVINLMNYGADHGATYFQVEAEVWDMKWDTAYMQGVAGFAEGLKQHVRGTPSVFRPINRIPLYQMWNSNVVDHYYTADTGSRDVAARAGWEYQSTIGWLEDAPSNHTIPLYEVYSDYNSDHFYTTSASERDNAIAAGWDDLPGTWRVVGYLSSNTSSNIAVGSMPLFSLWSSGKVDNPGLADHYYTTNAGEKNHLISNPDYNYLHYTGGHVIGHLFNNP